MVNESRQCFFFTENRTGKKAASTAELPLKNTRIYMNKMTISEENQFEICGFYSIPSTLVKSVIPTPLQQQITNELTAASGKVDLFMSGINLSKCNKSYNGMGSSI